MRTIYDGTASETGVLFSGFGQKFSETTGSFSAMTMVYEQNEKMFETFLTQATGLPEEGKKAVKDWMLAYRNGCNDFKKLVDANYAKVEEYFNKE